METAIERWQAIHDARAQQMDAAYARLGRTSADFWDRRARSFHRATSETVATDPFYLKLREIVTPAMSVLDVGAGTGRFALALAPQARQIIAVEPNASMLDYLRRDTHGRGITNVLYEMGIFANVEIVKLPANLRYPSLDVAVEELVERLILPDNEQVRGELRTLLAGWLVERDGMLVSPVREVVSAIMWWDMVVQPVVTNKVGA